MFTYRNSSLISFAAAICLAAAAVVDRVVTTCRAVSNFVVDIVLRAVCHVADSFKVEQPKVKGEQIVELIQLRDYLDRQLKRERVRKEAGWCMAPSI